jgi:hypothetical protein
VNHPTASATTLAMTATYTLTDVTGAGCAAARINLPMTEV